MRDIWPSRDEIQAVEAAHVIPEIFSKAYKTVKTGNPAWNALQVEKGVQYAWDNQSTYIQSPPFFETMERTLPVRMKIR